MGAIIGEMDGLLTRPLEGENEATLREAIAPHWEADLTVSDELVRALAGVLDIREVFPRISDIANAALPHDRLTMTFHDDHGNFVLHAASNADGPTAMRATRLGPGLMKQGTFKIIDDLRTYKPDLIYDPPDHKARVIAAGYRSVLAVCLSARACDSAARLNASASCWCETARATCSATRRASRTWSRPNAASCFDQNCSPNSWSRAERQTASTER